MQCVNIIFDVNQTKLFRSCALLLCALCNLVIYIKCLWYLRLVKFEDIPEFYEPDSLDPLFIILSRVVDTYLLMGMFIV